MEFKTEGLRKKSALSFLKIVLLSALVCLLIHFLFSRRREVAEEFNVWVRPYLHYPSEKAPTPKWIPKGDVLPLRKDKLDKDNRPLAAVIVVAGGGVGNQLFMYAAAYTFARCLGLPLFVSPAIPGNYDFGIFPEPHPNTLVREFLLHHFNIPSHQLINYDTLEGYVGLKQSDKPELVNGHPVKIDVVEIHEMNFHTTVEMNYRSIGDPQMSTKSSENSRRVYVLKHNFQSHLFFDGFEAEIKEIFNLQGYINSRVAFMNYYLFDLVNQAKVKESVGLHVRRGDFLLANSEYTPLPWTYYEAAMKMIIEKAQDIKNVHFYVFSDSLDMVKMEFEKRGLTKYGNMTFVNNYEGMTNLKELYLMEHCRTLVIPNSAFSWWGAYLNETPNKTVIAPYPRFTKEDYAAHPRKQMLENVFPIYPPDWKLLCPWDQ